MTEPTGTEVETVYAGFWWRALAVIIDTMIIQVFCATSISQNFLSGADKLARINELGYATLTFLYFTRYEQSVFQATPGKMICSIKVVDLHGYPKSWRRSTLCHTSPVSATFAHAKKIMP